MLDLTLEIAGRLADLPANLKGLVRLTQARAALADLDSRDGEYAWPLTLPPTRTNARIFGVGALHPLGLDKFAYVDFPYVLTCEAQIFTGTFRLASLKNGYTGQLLGEGFSWALQLGEKKLTDLRFGEVAYDGRQLEAILGLDCDSTDLQFPLLSFGNFFSPPGLQRLPDGTTEEVPAPPAAVIDYPLSVDDYPPSVYYANVLRQIFKEIGWSLVGRVLDEEQWRQTVLTCAGADIDKAWPWGALLPAAATSAGSECFSYFDAGPTAGGDRYTNNAVGFGEHTDGEIFFLPVPCPVVLSSPVRALNGALATYPAPRAGTFTFSYTCTVVNGHATIQEALPGVYDFASSAGFRAVGLALLVRRGGEDFADADENICYTGVVRRDQTRLFGLHRLDPLSREEGVKRGTYAGTARVFLEAGDTVQLVVFARRRLLNPNNGAAGLIRRSFVAQFSTSSFACTAYEDNDGVSKTLVQPSEFLPPLSQKEVVKDFLKKVDCVPVADPARRIVRLLSRSEQAAAAGEVLDISDFVDPASVEYAPPMGTGVGALVFAGPQIEDPLLPGGDRVRVVVGPGNGEQVITGLFAPVAYRNYRLDGGVLASIPTMADQASLDTPRSETAWDVKAQAPRLVRYQAPDASLRIPFANRTVPFAASAWDGSLRWAGPAGAVSTYYAGTVRRAARGHLARCSASLTPALYRQLVPGRRVRLLGGAYLLDAVSSYDLADEANQTSLELLREI